MSVKKKSAATGPSSAKAQKTQSVSKMSKTPASKAKRSSKAAKADASASNTAADVETLKPVASSTPPTTGVVATYVQRNPRPIEVETDSDDDSNLLTGPRNVQPYIVKRGEQYMSREQLDHFRTILESWKRDLMVEVDRTVSHMKDEAANFPDPNDRATQEEEFSLELRTRDRERKLIRKIEEALSRIEDGSYGYCLETGEEIGIKRLEARPVATLSLEAQERRERREKQYGDRDDRYR